MSAPSLLSVLPSALERLLGSCALISIGILVASNWNAIELNSGVVEFAPRRMEKAAWIVIAFYFAIFADGLIRHSHGNPFDLANAVCVGLAALVTLDCFSRRITGGLLVQAK